MKNLFSIFLSQSYQDCWDDYIRSIKSQDFPRWDYIVLTASNEQQAECFRKQIDERSGYLPTKTRFAVIPDKDGKRVGSGGATLSVLKYLHEPACAAVFCIGQTVQPGPARIARRKNIDAL